MTKRNQETMDRATHHAIHDIPHGAHDAGADDTGEHLTAGHDAIEAAGKAATEADLAALAAERAAEQSAEDAQADDETMANGVRARRTLTMKQFIPTDPDWIMREVVGKGRGTHVAVARLYGVVMGHERTVTQWQDKQLTSIKLVGAFEAQLARTGEIINAPSVYLPMAFAEQVEQALLSGAQSVQLDIDIGLEATGKPIPYEWTVTSYLNGEATRALRRLRNRRQMPLGLNRPGALAQLGHAGSAD